MTDVYTNPGTRGQTRSTWRDETHLRGILLKLVIKHPDADRDEITELYLAKTTKVPALVKEALMRALDNDLADIQRPARTRTDRTARPTEDEAAAATKRLKNIVYLDLIEPNGKKMRDCTAGEIRQFGGWRIAVADRVGDDSAIVGEKLSEAEVAKIFMGRACK